LFEDAKRSSQNNGGKKQVVVASCVEIWTMTIESIIRRRAFRDGFYDGRQGCPMRRLATRKTRWLYALGRIFANVAPTDLQVYEQRHATEAAVAAFRAMPVRCMAR
jgi:transposase